MQTAAICERKQQQNNDVGKETVLFWSNTLTLLNIQLVIFSSLSGFTISASINDVCVCVVGWGGMGGGGVDQNHCWIYCSRGGGGRGMKKEPQMRIKNTPRNQTFYTVAHQASCLNMNAPYKLIDTHSTQSMCGILIYIYKYIIQTWPTSRQQREINRESLVSPWCVSNNSCVILISVIRTPGQQKQTKNNHISWHICDVHSCSATQLLYNIYTQL